MIKILHDGKRVIHTRIPIITREKIPHILKRLREPFIQHLLVLIVSALLALCLGCTLFLPRPGAVPMTHTGGDRLYMYQSTGAHSDIGQQGRKGTQDQ